MFQLSPQLRATQPQREQAQVKQRQPRLTSSANPEARKHTDCTRKAGHKRLSLRTSTATPKRSIAICNEHFRYQQGAAAD